MNDGRIVSAAEAVGDGNVTMEREAPTRGSYPAASAQARIRSARSTGVP